MLKFTIRRVLQMIPTIFGVILITFVLFNIVGGSPAKMTLGKHASPQAMEEFDEARGFNKPLLLGLWAPTRALEDVPLDRNAGPWRTVEGVEHRPAEGRLPGRMVLPAGGSYEAPLAFSLRGGETYRMVVHYRTAPGSTSSFVVRVTRPGEQGAEPTVEEITRQPLSESSRWSRARLRFEAPEDGAGTFPVLEVKGTDMEVRAVRLERGVRHLLDSQFVHYLKSVLLFDFGTSSSTNQPVSRMLVDGMLPSLSLTVPIFLVGVVVTISLSLICAFFRNQFIDRFFVVLAVALMSINYLIWIIAGQYFLAYKLGWFPVWGFESFRFLVLPVIIGVVSGLGGGLRFYRTVMLDEMYKDYVRTAFAKGVSKRAVLFKHVLKNAMVPIVTNVVITIPFLVTGSLLLEMFFGIPGLGYVGINAIFSSDVDVLRAVVLFGAILYVIANLLTDICYALVDPRVKLS